METASLTPDFIFETSWEVCNKVGGIYTVLSSRAKTLGEQFHDNLIFIGPDVAPEKANPLFAEDAKLLSKWRKAAEKEGVVCRIGRWLVPGNPVAVLVDFHPYFEKKNEIYAEAWEAFGVDSMNAYGDYDEASMFSYAAGLFAEAVVKHCLKKTDRVVYQAHEWMSGLGMLFLKKHCPEVATIFTTHATSIGRSIAGNNKELYEWFSGYNGDQMARELNMEAKHSIEKCSAHGADCFTTVSTFTDRECKQLLDKPADVVLPNGFENDFVPVGAAFTKTRRLARTRIINIVSALTGEPLAEDTLIVSTSGRNDYRCKGFDVYLEALVRLERNLQAADYKGNVIALMEVPCWLFGPRQDLQERLTSKEQATEPLELPIITHDLYNLNEDRILCTMKSLGLTNEKGSKVKAVLVPCYLEGNDGIFNLPYYDLLSANDLAVYPSYYEPWGYTPLEACAFKTPCVTTDLSGFGQWVNQVLGHEGTLTDGVAVLHRTDNNYFDVADGVATAIETVLLADKKQRDAMRRKAAALADKAQWKHFIKHYYEAYAFALKKATIK